MRITRKEIRKIIKEQMSVEDVESLYGKFLFGDERKKKEPNTRIEQNLADNLRAWYFDQEHLSREKFQELIDLWSSGRFSDVLDTPSGTCFRCLIIPSEKLSLPPSPVRKVKNTEVLVYEIPGTSVSIYPDKFYASWSLGVEGAEHFLTHQVAENIFDYPVKEKGTAPSLLVWIGNTEENQENFIMNPKEIEELSFSDEKEIFQIKNVLTQKGFIYTGVRKIDLYNNLDEIAKDLRENYR